MGYLLKKLWIRPCRRLYLPCGNPLHVRRGTSARPLHCNRSFAERLVRQRADAAVALQGALANLEQHTEVLVVEHLYTFQRIRGFAGRLQGKQQFILPVEPFHQLPHPVLEIVSGKQFHTLCPPSFGFAARAQRVVMFQVFGCHCILHDGAVRKQAVYFRLAVAAFAA